MRQHMDAGDLRAYMDEFEGDPFRFRLPKRLRPPKALRKMTLKKAARFAAPFIPGFGGIAASLMAGPAAEPESQAIEAPPLEEELPVYPPELVQYARSFGIELGDPKPKPSGRRAAKPRPSAKGHRTKGTTSARPKPKGKGESFGQAAGKAFGHGLQRVKAGLPSLLDKASKADLLGMGAMALGQGPKLAFGGGRRSMNFANVRALKRGLRRIEGFEKIVKRVQKAYPRLKHATHHHLAPTKGRK